jgi:hypothetical protein
VCTQSQKRSARVSLSTTAQLVTTVSHQCVNKNLQWSWTTENIGTVGYRQQGCGGRCRNYTVKWFGDSECTLNEWFCRPARGWVTEWAGCDFVNKLVSGPQHMLKSRWMRWEEWWDGRWVCVLAGECVGGLWTTERLLRRAREWVYVCADRKLEVRTNSYRGRRGQGRE